MPSKKQYNLVHNDEYDTRIPLHSEEAFHRGIVFHAKFIGSMEVPRPTSRVEIVAAMRRIRYEFKAKGIKKKKVTLEVSVDGLKVTLRKKKKKQQQWMDENKIYLMHHPIYRIFYVSHDSHDLKIFSYIARDGSSNTFKCNVFKSSKKSQAMRVVRTVGQAFEVCHKLSINNTTEERGEKDGENHGENYGDVYEDQDEIPNEQSQPSPSPVHKDISLLGDTEDSVPEQTSVTCLLRSHDGPATTTSTSPIRQSPSGTVTSECGGLLVGGELTALKHEIQLLRERLEQQSQQTRAAVAHARLLQDQLAAETAARVEAQTRTHQLLVQNKELLEHISALVAHLREQERVSGGHVTSQSQIPTPASMQPNAAISDLSSLGQCQRTGGQSSPWELEPPTFPYCTYPSESLYSGGLGAMGIQSNNTAADQLQFQTQLLERLHNLSPFQPQRSPYNTPSPYAMGPSLLLPPCSGPTADSTRSMGQMRIPGILRLDKTTRSSEFTATQTLAAMQVGPSSSSSQSHPGRQSVTFSIVEFQRDEDLAERNKKSWSDTRHVSITGITSKRESISQSLAPMEKSTADGEEIDSEDDYSASVSAIMQQRNSTRRHSRRKRRPSSPFGDNVDGVARRRSSVYTTSSGDTVISMDESGHQEQIFENVKLHKEVLSGIKQQPWTLRRKIKLVRQAKAYIRRHEGALQERLAQNRSTKDVIARVSLIITKKWQYFRRELVNLQTWLIPWEVRIMEIESHFGSAVASYFTFLRWLFWINLVIAAILVVLVVIPKILVLNATLTGGRELNQDSGKASLQSLWKFEGVLKNSPFFYGWYTNQKTSSGYKLSLAYFVTNLVVYTYSFVAILRKMAENSRLSKLTEKEDEYVFSWKLFTGWDFMIGNPETAHNRTASTVRGFKEALLEEAEKQKDERNWRIISIRIFVNMVVLSLLALSAYTVINLVQLSTNKEENWWRQNSITIVMSLITYLFPILFEILGFFESYHPRKQLRIQLARIMFLNLLNLYALIIPQFREMQQSSVSSKLRNNCKDIRVPCSNELPRMQQIVALASSNLVLMNNTRSHVKRDLPNSTHQFIMQDFLNPLWDSASDYNDSNTDYDNYQYETSNTDDDDSFSSTALYHENNTESVNNEIHNDASSTVTANFMTDSMATELFHITSTSSRSKTTTPTTMQSNIVDDKCSLHPCDPNTCNPKERNEPCWETRFGQELAKLTVMDLILTILATLSMDFFRAVFVRFMNNCWCWDLEKQFPQYGDFKIAENILHLVNNQGMIWMGMFFSPGLTVLNLFKLGILMYLRSWAVLTCNVPHEVVFRASRSHNFYFALLLAMLFFCVLPVGYAIVWIKPSCECGPFSGCSKIYELATRSLICWLPKWMEGFLQSAASSSTVIPLIVLMTLIIYYMASLAKSLREANNDLKIQLRHERTEERRKLFKIAEKRHTVAETPLSRWKKILPALPQARISQNFETAKRDDIQVQMTIENVNDKTESKQLTNSADDSSSQKQISLGCDNNQRTEEQNDSVLDDISSNKRSISVVGCSWGSPLSGQSVIVPEIQVNNEDNVFSDIHGIVEVPSYEDQKTTLTKLDK